MSLFTRGKVFLWSDKASYIGYDAGTVSIVVDGTTVTTMTSADGVNTTDNLVLIGDVDTYMFRAADSGKTHVVEAITGNLAFTLPAAAAGLEYTLFHGGIIAEGDNWIITTAEVFLGGMVFLDEDAGAADGVDTVQPDGTDNTMTIVVPDVGTRIHVISDGTSWFVSATIVAATIPTFTTV